MNILFTSIIIGLSLAIPVGPVTIEMIRRNLRYGLLRGIIIGLGASSADVTYLLLLLFGILPLIKTSTWLLHTIGVGGAALLMWFAYKTIRQKSQDVAVKTNDGVLWHCFLSGYLIAALSPFNILFWLAVAGQFATLLSNTDNGYALVCAGLFIGTAIWFVALNLIVHRTRHHLSTKTILWLNRIGSITIIIFAVYGVWHIFTKI